MPPVRLVLDSNSYFRLACSIRPLLDASFGPEPCRLAVIKELDDEFSRSQRLRSKFGWVLETEYRQDRLKGLLTVTRQQRKNIDLAFEYILNHDALEGRGVSPVDIRVLATAYVLGYAAVTDDGDMRKVAADLCIQTYSTLELMKQMLDRGFIDMGQVHQVVEYWDFDHDLPAPPAIFRPEFKRIFGEDMP